MKKERERDSESWLKEKGDLENKLIQADLVNKNINKKMNGNIANNKDVT